MARPHGSTTTKPAENRGGRKETFGHRKAELALAADESFTGLAAIKEAEIAERWHSEGILSVIEDNTLKMQTVFELYESLVMSKLDAGDPHKVQDSFDRFLRWGARVNNELWRLQERQERIDDGSILVDAVEAAREATDGDG